METNKQNKDIHWEEIQTVFLDMDGTLLDLYFDDFFWQTYLPEQYARLNKLDYEQAQGFLNLKFEANKGTLSWYCTDFWSRNLGIDVVELKEEISHLIKVHDHVMEFLHVMKKMKKRIVLVTNAHPSVVNLKFKHTGIGNYFDRVISSHTLGHAKEEIRLWQKLQVIEPFNKTKTLFVDDNQDVLRSAQQYGIRHLFGISKPSSRKKALIEDEFPLIENFAQITPSVTGN